MLVVKCQAHSIEVVTAWGEFVCVGQPMTSTQLETATFVAELCKELRSLTEGAGLTSLTYLLDMAVLEACLTAESEQRVKSAA